MFTRPLRSRFVALAALSAIAFTTACSDSMTAPVSSAETTRQDGLISDLVGGLLNGLIPVKPLTRTAPVTSTVTRSVRFTQAGGSIALPELGLTVQVPANALPRDTMTITVTAVRGNMVAYEFEPHGTQFKKPLVFRQDLNGTSWGNSLIKTLNGGYFKNASQLNQTTGIALLDELLPAITLNRQVSFEIKHFSGYMVSGGRKDISNDDMF